MAEAASDTERSVAVWDRRVRAGVDGRKRPEA